ncbi:MAG: hypothetical protein WDA20_09900 [Desulfuromonadales bacterium]
MIAPSDEELNPWLTKGCFGSPKKKDVIASRFVYETSLAKAIHIGKQLYSGVKPAEVTVGERDYLYQAYLRQLYGM